MAQDPLVTQKNNTIFKSKWVFVIIRTMILCILLGIVFWKLSKSENSAANTDTIQEHKDDKEQSPSLMENSNPSEPLATFQTEDQRIFADPKNFVLEDYYIKNQVTAINHYFIDEQGNLWGYGENTFGQLGIGDAYLGEDHDEPAFIAENVVSVDSSDNGYFCIYLTANGELYGMGSNMLGLLGQEYSIEEQVISESSYTKVPSPILLMENVAYARAGRDAIVALKDDGSVWWWGQYRHNYIAFYDDNGTALYWSAVEDDTNPVKMFSASPKKILENCVYVDTGNWHGVAIGQNGALYTWGLNYFGECGTAVSGDKYQRTPQMVLENVYMVWPEKLEFEDSEGLISERLHDDTTYSYNTFVQLKDGSFLAAGQNIDGKMITVGRLFPQNSYSYSDTFVPIQVELYEEAENREKLSKLSWGTSVQEAEDFLAQNGLEYSLMEFTDDNDYIWVEDGRYGLFFDETRKLEQIWLCEGGSRNLQFHVGMSKEEVQDLLGTDFVCEVTQYDGYTIYWSSVTFGDSYYGFVFENDILVQVWEKPA